VSEGILENSLAAALIQESVWWRAPQLDCVTNADGLLTVLCSLPGWFDTAAIARERLCASCLHFMPLSTDRSEPKECNLCGAMQEEKVDACKVCEHDNGEFVMGDTGTVHALCATFQKGVETAEEAKFCHLCSKNSRGVVSCAAVHCQVSFHPWCARVISRLGCLSLSVVSADDVSSMSDAYLCTQFTCAMLDVEAVAPGNHGQCGKKLLPSMTRLPVVYCGFHNPKRQVDRIGLYPEGNHLQGALRVPPRAGCT
jgi:hypothetical protein